MRILAIAPSTRGFGFAVLEGDGVLVDWGAKTVKGDKNAGCIAKAQEMIVHFRPAALVLEDYSAEGSRRAPRVRLLGRGVAAMCSQRDVEVVLFSREQVRKVYFPDGQGTKHALAKLLARRFPEELGLRVPPKRRPWMSEDYRTAIFEAVALAVTFQMKGNRKGRGAK